MTFKETIHDLKAIKKSYMEDADGCYPVCLDNAIEAIEGLDQIQAELERTKAIVEEAKRELPKEATWKAIEVTIDGIGHKTFRCPICRYIESYTANYCAKCGSKMRKPTDFEFGNF